ncbi:MAG: hypothetical protein ACOYU4_03120 [Thermodesulfobacteriota bacterium]
MPARVDAVVYARHGREFKGCKSPVREPCPRSDTLAEVPAEGKGGIVRDRLKEAGVQSYEPTNRNGIVVPEYRDEGRNAERRKGIP